MSLSKEHFIEKQHKDKCDLGKWGWPFEMVHCRICLFPGLIAAACQCSVSHIRCGGLNETRHTYLNVWPLAGRNVLGKD